MKKAAIAGITAASAVIVAGGIFAVWHFTAGNAGLAGELNENLRWTFEDGTLTVSGNGAMNDFYSAKEQPWADFYDEIKKVVIEDGVTSVGSFSFYLGYNITELSLGSTVESIGDSAFAMCEGISELTIPDSVAFMDCFAFQDIGITSLELPDNGITLEMDAFWNCDKLEEITIPESVTFASSNPFYDTPWFQKQKEENPLVIVNNCVLDGEGCTGDVVIPDGVTSISVSAFVQNYDITSVTIPDSCTSIGMDAFWGCEKLQNVVLPETVTEIGYAAFTETPWFAAVTGDEPMVILNGVLLDGFDAEGDIIIPDNVTSICEMAFSGNENITSVTIPESTVSIGKMSFCNCSSLTDIIIENPDCEISDAMTDPSMDPVIHGYKGSTAEEYAEINGLMFAEID